MQTRDGWVGGVDLVPIINDVALSSKDTGSGDGLKDVNELHHELGHVSKVVTQKTAKALKIPLKSPFSPCNDCLLGKAKQKKVSKSLVARSTKSGERVFFDVSLPRTASVGGNKHWLLVVDDFSDYCWSIFLKKRMIWDLSC